MPLGTRLARVWQAGVALERAIAKRDRDGAFRAAADLEVQAIQIGIQARRGLWWSTGEPPSAPPAAPTDPDARAPGSRLARVWRTVRDLERALALHCRDAADGAAENLELQAIQIGQQARRGLWSSIDHGFRETAA